MSSGKSAPVLCFSRDDTIRMCGGSVPLSWIQYYAHHTNHHVWAIGNQQLQIEAGIPTPYEARQIMIKHNIPVNSVYSGGHKHRTERLQILDTLYNYMYGKIKILVITKEDIKRTHISESLEIVQHNRFSNYISNNSIKEPKPDEVSGDAYYDTNKFGTYESMLNEIEKRIREN